MDVALRQLDLLHDFGGGGSILHLAHANGFPPGTYRPLAETLTASYRVLALPQRPLWPGSHPEDAPSWHILADDLLQGLEALDRRPIVGIGHSLGGVLTLQAAVKRPSLFAAVVLIDPVILPPDWLRKIRQQSRRGTLQRTPLVRGARHRRTTWPSHQACFEHFRRKAPFARWTDDALMAYVEAGTRGQGDAQATLVYPPQWEAHIFATPPTSVWRDVSRLQTRTLVIRGEHSDTFTAAAERRVARHLPHARCLTIPGAGHLVAMERPAETGANIRRFLESVDLTGSRSG
jgi:pimeloyl-ACP methyl ester carboxylesterase